MGKKKEWKQTRASIRVFMYIFMGVMFMISVIPFLYLLALSLSKYEDAFSVLIIPKGFIWNNYVEAWKTLGVNIYYKNSIIVSVTSLIINIIIGSMAAYGFARFMFRFKEIAYTIFLFGFMIPSQALIIPLFINLRTLHLLNSYFTLILVYPSLGLAFTIFVMRSFFATLPKELTEAAKIEGCTEFQTFWKIMMPLAKPGMAAVSLFQFIWFWDEFLLAITFITDKKKLTLPAGLASLHGEYFINYPVLSAGLVIAIIPVIIIFLIVQRHFVEGLTMGALKV